MLLGALFSVACVDRDDRRDPQTRADLLRGGDPVDLNPHLIDAWKPLKATCMPDAAAQTTLADGSTMARFEPAALGLRASVSWADADDACARMGGVLSPLNTKDAREAAATLAAPPDRAAADTQAPWGVWIGLSQGRNAHGTAEAWGWRDGMALFVSDWAPGEPDDDNGAEDREQDCAALGADGWRDTGCTRPRPWAMLCTFPSAQPACVGDAQCAPARHDDPYRCQCDPGEAYLPGSGGCVMKPACTALNPQSCDGVCDPQDDADSGDCDAACAPNDSPGSPDCDGACAPDDFPGSPDCDDACGGDDLPGSPDCDGICAPRDEGDHLDCDGDCDPYDALGSPDCDGGCSLGESLGSRECDGVCDPEDSAASDDCDGVCDPQDARRSPDCDRC